MTAQTTDKFIAKLKTIYPFLGKDMTKYCKTCGKRIPNNRKAHLYCKFSHEGFAMRRSKRRAFAKGE